MSRSEAQGENLIELMSISQDLFLQACSQFPDSSNLIQIYSIRQVKYLSKIRERREHLNPSNEHRLKVAKGARVQ